MEDLDALHALYADPAVWTHLPSGRHEQVDVTLAQLARVLAGWSSDGLSSWVVRERGSAQVIGVGGCDLRRGFWNLGYRLSPSVQGRGYATELSRAGAVAALALRPELPVIAYLLENNAPSARVAEKAGLRLMCRALDAGNPDPTAVRLVFADRELTPAQVAAALE